MADSRQRNLKEWLQNLARESWQLELLVSAFTIFLLVQASGSFSEFLLSIPYLYNIQDAIISLGFILLGTLNMSLKVLILSLVTHLLMRGFWIGAIGLRSVQPNIDFGTFNYSEFFTKKLEKRVMNLDDLVVKLDEVCSVIFSFTFLMISLLISLGLFVVTAGLIAILGQAISDAGNEFIGDVAEIVFGFIIFFFILGGLIYAIDFITLGFFKKFKRLSKIYYPFYYVLSIITLSFISRGIYYHMIQKYSKRNIRLLYLFVLAVFFSYVAIDYDQYRYFSDASGSYSIDKNLYDDLRSEKAFVEKISVPSMQLDGAYLPLYIRYYSGDNSIIQSQCPELITPKEEGFNFGLTIQTRQEGFELNEESTESGVEEEMLKCLTSIYNITINGKPVENLKFFYNRHSNTSQPGIICMIPAEKLIVGENLLSVKKRMKVENDDFQPFANVKVWK